jgi:hypothetical protein
MPTFIPVNTRAEARDAARQHLENNPDLSGGNLYELPDGSKLRVRKKEGGRLSTESYNTKTTADGKRDKFDVTSTDSAAVERSKIDTETRRLNKEAQMYGLETGQLEHLGNQKHSQQLTSGAPGDPDRVLRVPKSSARLKDNVEQTVRKYDGGVYNNPAEESIKVVEGKYYDPIADPQTLPGINIKDQAAFKRFRSNLAKHRSLSEYIKLGLKHSNGFAAHLNPYVALAIELGPDVVDVVNERTNGSVDKTISNGVKNGVSKTVNGVNGIVKQLVDYYADKLPGATNGFNFTD